MSSYNEFELVPSAKVIDQAKKDAEEEAKILLDIKKSQEEGYAVMTKSLDNYIKG